MESFHGTVILIYGSGAGAVHRRPQHKDAVPRYYWIWVQMQIGSKSVDHSYE